MPTYKYLNDTGLERTLSKLKTYIDSQSGGGSDGHGFIICDTSTMQVGDRIRVRSVYTVLEEQYNQTKEVVTVGQPVTFAVPCYDYYKVCTVQDTSAIAYVYIQQSLTGYEAKVSYSGNIKWQSETGTYEDNYIKLYRETANDDWTLKAVGTCVYDGNTYTSGQTIATLPYNQSTTYCVNATAPTEVGGVYKTVDYGQTLFIDNIFDLHTLRGIQNILNAHSENYVLNIGDEVTIKINDGGTPKDWVMQIAGIDLNDSHEVIFASKHIWDLSQVTSAGNAYYVTPTAYLRTKMQDFYNNIDNADKQYIKTMLKCCKQAYGSGYSTFEDYVYPPTYLEMVGSVAGGTPPVTLHQYPLFTTQANRIKTYNGNATRWWTCDGHSSNGIWYYFVETNGNVGGTASTNYGVVPCFRLTADS